MNPTQLAHGIDQAAFPSISPQKMGISIAILFLHFTLLLHRDNVLASLSLAFAKFYFVFSMSSDLAINDCCLEPKPPINFSPLTDLKLWTVTTLPMTLSLSLKNSEIFIPLKTNKQSGRVSRQWF